MRLSLDDENVKNVLNTGCYQNSRGWVALQLDKTGITFSQVSGERPSNWVCWFKSIRAISLTATLMPATATLLFLWTLHILIKVDLALFSLLSMVLLQISVNLFNDVEDYLKLIDLPDSLGGSGVIQSGWLSADQVRRVAWICFILAGLLVLPVFLQAPIYILLCALLAGVGVIGYSSQPFGFKYQAMGDVLVFLLCGPVLTVGVSLAVSGQVPVVVSILGLYFGFLACGILNANNLNDIDVDAQRGAKTLATALGFHRAGILQVVYYLLASISLVVLAVEIHVLILLPLIGLPLIANHLKQILRANTCDDPSLNEVRFDAARLHLLMSVMCCLSLILIGWL